MLRVESFERILCGYVCIVFLFAYGMILQS